MILTYKGEKYALLNKDNKVNWVDERNKIVDENLSEALFKEAIKLGIDKEKLEPPKPKPVPMKRKRGRPKKIKKGGPIRIEVNLDLDNIDFGV